MILAEKGGWVSLLQCDITAAFVTAILQLKLKTCLYGMCRSPRYFFAYLSKKFEAQGLLQSNLEPCLFYGKDLVGVTYVDDVLIYPKWKDDIADLIACIKKDRVNIREEGTAKGYFGLKVKRNGQKITLSQPGMIQKDIEALGLSSKFSTSLSTLAEQAALPRNIESELVSVSRNYPSLIGMLHYLGHKMSDYDFAIHQCACHTFEQKVLYEAAVKQIGCYLKGTMDKGSVLNLWDDYGIDCYPDADVVGL